MRIAEYDKYIKFTDAVIDGLQNLPQTDRNSYKKLMKDIKTRKANPYLNVALIGDFSSGKSTFINTFIQKNILKTAWLATTAIPTHIFYNEDNVLQIVVKGMEHDVYRLDSPKERKKLGKKLGVRLEGSEEEILTILSTKNEFISKIKMIEVYVHSFEALQNICIIDTPGVNPGAHDTKEHVEATRNVLREYADATIILFRAQNVYTNSFRTFLEENATHFMNDAIFVITMMDLIEEEERDEVIEFVRENLKENFCLKNPKVYACSAKYAEESIGNESKKGAYWRPRYDQLRKEIIHYMNSSREKIIGQQVQKLLEKLMIGLDDEVRADMRLIEEQLEVLKRNSIDNLQMEMQKIEKEYVENISQVLSRTDAEWEYDNMFSEVISRAENSINLCIKIRGDASDSVTGYMKYNLPSLIKQKQELFSMKMKTKISAAQQELQSYYNANKIVFEKYSVDLIESENKIALREEQEGFQNDFGTVGYYEGEGMQLVFDAAGMVTKIAVGLPLAFVDGLLGTSMSDSLFDAVDSVVDIASGMTDGLVNMFGNLASKKANAISTMKNSVNRMRDGHRKEFLDQFDEQKKAVFLSMADIGREFMHEYASVYNQTKTRMDEERQRLKKEIKNNQCIHEKLKLYLKELK